jgi:hypothetical protein
MTAALLLATLVVAFLAYKAAKLALVVTVFSIAVCLALAAAVALALARVLELSPSRAP